MGGINYIALLGYFILSCVYLYFIQFNTKDIYSLIGVFIITFGYSILFIETYIDIIDEKDEELKKSKKEESYKISYGFLILAIFYILGIFLPINTHDKPTDKFALFGNLGLAFLIKNKFDNINADILKIICIILLVIYYVLYAIRNTDNISLNVNKAQVIGAILLIIFHCGEVYREFNEQLEKDKLKKE
jgi:hypothetical protein